MLTELHFNAFRNLEPETLTPAARVNLFLGGNGAGKTSILEAIHLLGLGRSFRTRQLKQIIQKNAEQTQLFGRINGRTPVGFQYHQKQGALIRFNSAPLKKLSDLASSLPLQFIPADCHEFFDNGPRFRRKLVDWGLFHVEQNFFYHWQSYKKALQQRNSGIRQLKSDEEIRLWDPHLIKHGEQLNILRHDYLKIILDGFSGLFRRVCPAWSGSEFNLRFYNGWPKEQTLTDVLAQNLARDRALAYTRSGAHAADWLIRIDQQDPSEILSRGEQKLFFLALCLAQINYSMLQQQISIILLLDDLSSELDNQHQQAVLDLLCEMPVQSFITSTNQQLELMLKNEESHHVFHVKQGKVSSGTSTLSHSTDT